MAGPGKPGPPARGSETLLAEERKTRVLELYVQEPRPSYREIAEMVGWKDHHSVKRVIDQSIAERGVEARSRAWLRADELIEATRRSVLRAFDECETRGAPIAPQMLSAAASILAAYDKHYGLKPNEFPWTVEEDVEAVCADDGEQQVAIRSMLGLGELDLDGVRSGRSAHQQFA